MAQLNLYVPDEVAARLKREARKARQPLSRYVLSLLEPARKSGWPPGYFEKFCGSLHEDFPEPEDRAPEPVDSVETQE